MGNHRERCWGRARLQTLQGMTNHWSPLVIYPLGPETQDTNTGKGGKAIGKANLAKRKALLRGDFPHHSKERTRQQWAFFWRGLSHPMDRISNSLELIFGPGVVQRALTFSACRGQPQSPEQGPLQGKGPL